jgi:putative DNA primase/helicase
MSFSERQFEPSVELPYGYSFSSRGLMWQDPKPPGDGEESKPSMHIAGNFDVAAMARNGDSNSWGLLLKWKDPDGRDHSFVLPHELLVTDGAEARRVLTSQGLYISPNVAARGKFNAFLLQVKSPNRALSTESVGWNGNAFVLPDECIGGNTGETLLLLNATNDHSFKQSGTLEEWQKMALLAVGNSRLVLAISMAFVGPLLGPCSEEGGGIHFKGSSSIGKTTALHAAGSVWGGGGSNGYVKSWRATANGLESTCLNHSDTFLCLDEMAQITAKDAGEAAYMIANGSGKSRSRTDGSARKTVKFRVMFLSSGEIGLADKVAEDGRGKKMTAGQQIRIVDIPADAGKGLGLFEDLHDFESGKALSKHIVASARTTYGTAGRAYLRAIMPEIDDIRRQATGVMSAFCEQFVPAGADGQVQRVAQRFALIAFAGELAIRKGILPWEDGEAVKAAVVCFEAWLAERGHAGAAEAYGGVEAVRSFLQQHGMSRFVDAWGEEKQALEHERLTKQIQEAGKGLHPPAPLRPPIPQRDVCGFRRKVESVRTLIDPKTGEKTKVSEEDGWEFFANDVGWAEMCTGFNPKTLAKTLADMKMLTTECHRDLKVRYKVQQRIPGHGKGKYYYISAAFLNEE